MNRRYIDFVPSKNEKPVELPVEKKPKTPTKIVYASMPAMKTPKKTVEKKVVERKPVVQRKPVIEDRPTVAKKPIPKVGYSTKVANYRPEPVLGVIVDLSPLIRDTEKRPLGTSRPTSNVDLKSAETAKSQKVGKKLFGKKAEKKTQTKDESVKKSAEAIDNKVYKTPKTPFINQTNVEKRPLSKNVYQKKTEPVVVEQPKGPVTIISKPEKQAHVSIIVTIIITIILGAAAGTVAFLLLPK